MINRLLRREFVARLVLVAVGLLLAPVSGEIALRIVYADKFGKRPLFYVADDTLGYKPNADLDHTFYGRDFRITMRTDAEGYRLGSLGEVGFDKRLVLLSGDSNVFGWGVSTDETCASFLDEYLSEISHGGTRVVNLGVGGYGTLQYYVRLARFLERHAEAQIPALFVVHAPNDATDNVEATAYHAGYRQTRDKAPRSRSSFHMVNFVGYLLRARTHADSLRESPGKQGVIDPYLQDMLFGFEHSHSRRFPARIRVGRRSLDLTGVTARDWDVIMTYKRKQLTRIQRQLALLSVNLIHDALAGRNTTIFHVILPVAEDWYALEWSRILKRAAPSEGNRVVLLGRYPDVASYEGELRNAHSGGHFTPAFNRYWAERLAEVLREHEIVAVP
ncbi:MAG: hypothetical protein ACE5EO_00545 [Candidatus Krumholzibacteriia bacterium]